MRDPRRPYAGFCCGRSDQCERSELPQLARQQQADVSSYLSKRDEFFCGETDIFGDLSNEDRRYLPPAVIRNRRAATIRMAKLFMRAALADFRES